MYPGASTYTHTTCRHSSPMTPRCGLLGPRAWATHKEIHGTEPAEVLLHHAFDAGVTLSIPGVGATHSRILLAHFGRIVVSVMEASTLPRGHPGQRPQRIIGRRSDLTDDKVCRDPSRGCRLARSPGYLELRSLKPILHSSEKAHRIQSVDRTAIPS